MQESFVQLLLLLHFTLLEPLFDLQELDRERFKASQQNSCPALKQMNIKSGEYLIAQCGKQKAQKTGKVGLSQQHQPGLGGSLH